MEIPRNPVSLTVSRMLELNQHLVHAIYNTAVSAILARLWIEEEKLHNISF